MNEEVSRNKYLAAQYIGYYRLFIKIISMEQSEERDRYIEIVRKQLNRLGKECRKGEAE